MQKRTSRSMAVLLIAVVVSISAFQNCTPSNKVSASDPSIASVGGGRCSDSGVLGRWVSNPDAPDDPRTESLTFKEDCTGVSRLCSGQFDYPSVPGLNGQVQIQMKSVDQGSNCIPVGTYACDYQIHQLAESGRILTIACSGMTSMTLYSSGFTYGQTQIPTATPEPEATAVPSTTPLQAKKMYVTTNQYPSTMLQSSSQLDQACMTDSGKPARITAAKAFLNVPSQREACSRDRMTGEIGCGTTGGMDWVLSSNTAYTRADGTPISTTDASGMLKFPLQHSFADGPQKLFWTDMPYHFGYTAACYSLPSFNSVTGLVWKSDQTSRESLVTDVVCNTSQYLLCVEQ